MKPKWYVIDRCTKKVCKIVCGNPLGCPRPPKNQKLVVQANENDYHPGCCSLGDQLNKDRSNWKIISNNKLLLLTAKCKDEEMKAHLKKILKKRL